MAEVFDVTLGSTGYMVKPGNYQRFQDGQSEGRVGRVRLFDFYGGGKRAAQLERDRFWSGVGAWPTFDSQGIVAGPGSTDRTLSPTPAFVPTNQHFSFAYGTTTYVISGTALYSVATSGGNFNGLTHVQTFGGTVVDYAVSGDTVYVCFGSALLGYISSYNFSTSVYAQHSINYDGRYIGNEGGTVLFVDETAPSCITNQFGTHLVTADGPILRLAQVNGHIWMFTANTIWRLTNSTGTAAVEASMPGYGGSDDFAFAVTHFGKLWTWAGKEVIYYDTSTSSFTGTGLRGQGTLGACTVGAWLVIVVEDLVTGDPEMWAWDGRGWWQLEDGSTTYSYPISIFGSCDDADMLSGRGVINNYAETWQFFARSGSPGYRSSVELVTALLDASERDLTKVWRRAGIEIATPDDRATSDQVTVELFYSADGGATWTSIDSATLDNSSDRLQTVGGSIAARPQSRFLQLKASVTSISAWCPVVVGLWAEHETMDLPTRRRRWRFTLNISDAVVKRDGSVDATGARSLATGLWSLWDDGAIETFKDVDYDLTATSYSVRIAGIREVLSKPADVAIASSDLELTLVEV